MLLRTWSRLHSSGSRRFSTRWFGIDSEYISMRGLGIAKRVFNELPHFMRQCHENPRIFTTGLSDEVRSSMFVLLQFPSKTRIDLLEFVQGAEQVAHTVLQSLYTSNFKMTKTFLEQFATPQSLEILLNKPSLALQGENCMHVKLEQLDISTATLEAVEYTRERFVEDIKSEWLTIRVQYDVTEHLLISSEDRESIEDRRVINTQFVWTFEADVTEPNEVEWAIVAATPFQEKLGVLKANAS
ncbi:hypothetical protein Plhal304r1_c010g0038331 [Plasmopara halstedii]